MQYKQSFISSSVIICNNGPQWKWNKKISNDTNNDYIENKDDITNDTNNKISLTENEINELVQDVSDAVQNEIKYDMMTQRQQIDVIELDNLWSLFQ